MNPITAALLKIVMSLKLASSHWPIVIQNKNVYQNDLILGEEFLLKPYQHDIHFNILRFTETNQRKMALA